MSESLHVTTSTVDRALHQQSCERVICARVQLSGLLYQAAVLGELIQKVLSFSVA